MDRRVFLKKAGMSIALTAIGANVTTAKSSGAKPKDDRPNIVFCISDDQSWLHTSAAGDKVVKTPNFDRIAKEGVMFTNSFCAAPSCTPSRSALLTGQDIWRLESGGVLFGALPGKFKVLPYLLEDAGYSVGRTKKGWGPGSNRGTGRKRNPAGPSYKNFAQFNQARPKDKPFFYLFGSGEPHRPYEWQSGIKSGMKIEDVTVPPTMSDTEIVRTDICDYYYEIQKFDDQVGEILKTLEETGEFDNTIIVITSDNGMPFPRAKCTLYDLGTRMPLAIRWGKKVKGPRTVDDFINHTDFAPTFLEAAGAKIPAEMTGKSFLDVLLSGKSGQVDPKRDRVFTALERHTLCRPGWVGYPSRAIRTHDWLYIRNYEPDRWPAGNPDFESVHQGVYGDIDAGPARTYMIEHKEDPDVRELFELGFGKRPGHELYNVKDDPYQMKNLASDARYIKVKSDLQKQLDDYLKQTDDPRMRGENKWDDYPYYFMDFWKKPRPKI